MPQEFKAGCQRPPIKKEAPEIVTSDILQSKEETMSMVKVGKPAPDFTAPGFYQGKFMNFNLAEYAGKWVLVCFYPGDFTFV